MKFNKELKEKAIPEWKTKYLDYKVAKKKLKAVARAARNINRPSQEGGRSGVLVSSLRDGPVYSYLKARGWGLPGDLPRKNLATLRSQSEVGSPAWARQGDLENGSAAVPIAGVADERSPLRQSEGSMDGSKPQMKRYGSIIGSRPGSRSSSVDQLSKQRTQASFLELPDPAIDPKRVFQSSVTNDDWDYDRPVSPGSGERARGAAEVSGPPASQLGHVGNAYDIHEPKDLLAASSTRSATLPSLQPRRINSTPSWASRPRLIQRVMSIAGGNPSTNSSTRENDVALEAYRDYDFRKAEFFHFLDSELDKVDNFYKEKEEEATARLEELRQQLHILREMRIRDIEAGEHRKKKGHFWNGRYYLNARVNKQGEDGNTTYGPHHMPQPTGHQPSETGQQGADLTTKSEGQDSKTTYSKGHSSWPPGERLEWTGDNAANLQEGIEGEGNKSIYSKTQRSHPSGEQLEGASTGVSDLLQDNQGEGGIYTSKDPHLLPNSGERMESAARDGMSDLAQHDQGEGNKDVSGQSHLLRNGAERIEWASWNGTSDLTQHNQSEGGKDVSGHRHLSRLTGDRLRRARNSVASQVDNALSKARTGHVGKTSEAMRDLGTPLALPVHAQDYQQPTITYRVAKRMLKAALTQYYNSLELLQRYSLLNQTAFRKIAKKCDKTIPGRHGRAFYEQRVRNASFAISGTPAKNMDTVEDLYARYFERGAREPARAHLRKTGYDEGSNKWPLARSMLYLGIGIMGAVNAIVAASGHLNSPLGDTSTATNYLLQLYAGFFLCFLFMLLFCCACWEFAKNENKINWPVIFRLNTKTRLTWERMLEIPSLFILYLGVVATINFEWVDPSSKTYPYWPAVLLGLCAMTICLPFPILYMRTRAWFLRTIIRVCRPGYLRVEFEDVFLGDVLCSCAYIFGNTELFFCLYAREWNDPPACNSSHSIVLGVLTAIPGLFRALQCGRRYWDTGKQFPHLLNAGKYCFTMATAACLSAYRLKGYDSLLTAYAVVAMINAVYCIIWDIFFDWSLGRFDVSWFFLRETMLFKHVWWYYTAIILDVAVRMNWIFYIIFRNETQLSSVVSFGVALSEIMRRAMWAVFRLENEQISHNNKLADSAETDLPFPERQPEVIEPPATTELSPLMQRLRNVQQVVANAHSDDYEAPPVEDDLPEEDEDEDA